ncbi:UDP-N-acetylmuramate dehydrogenase [Pelosinus fermentans]|uniref:UDP-N-acetylenolpyruvoylglucosamine reductase n=1 Tax=Pelosinus fermentans JBW45 TaxID=1192197 RepID=I8U016_9FIRM|nr:UDP-N-acetylmuramate dehydrogenase [Pelosinus fermentans]AJQ28143.1 UDP-N-acetylenolpyruvoylglucosamine reductase [Pelosinus fermentans JBW45]
MKRNNLSDELLLKLKQVIPECRLLINEPLSKHTTFKIGGPADYLVFPASMDEISAIMIITKQYGIPVTVLGNGSNILVRDKGIKGLVLKFGSEMSYIRHTGALVTAGAGAMLADVSCYAAKHGLSGMEFAIGIPGSIGGAVFMNAGAYSGEMCQVVTAVSGVCRNGNIQRFLPAQIQFGYRHSIFQDNGCIVCEVELTLQKQEKPAISQKMDEYTFRRESKQPLEMPSAGSTFKRPPGNFAGTLIEKAGLKGLQVGGAQVSMKHAGFVINAGGATAEDVLLLIEEVQRRVYEDSGIMLHPEVRVIGEE